MSAFGNVVAGFDASSEAADGLALATMLGELSGGDLIVARVMEDLLDTEVRDRRVQRLVRDRMEDTRRAVVAAVPGTEDTDLLPLYDVSVTRALHALAREEDAAWIVLGSRHGSHARRLAGGTARTLIPGAPCPVAIAPPGYRLSAPERPATIGVGYDGSPQADHALDHALDLAGRADARLRIISVDAQPELGRGVRRAAAATGAFRVEGAAPSGHPATALAEESRVLDLLVMGSHGRGAIGRALLGSVTSRVIARSACPLVIVPPGA
jgi:nucleotide-binding universal stress UspA family protein